MARQLETDNGTIYFPGVDGIPYRGTENPFIKKDDPRQPQETLDAKVKILDLSIDEDLKEYQRIWDMISKDLYVYSSERVMENTEKGNWKVLIRYAERYAEMPNYTQNRLKLDANQTSRTYFPGPKNH